MNQSLYNFFEETLMEWDKHRKKYAFSMRRICIAICFPYALRIGWHLVFDENPNEIGIQVFATIFTFISVGLAINLVSYVKNEEPNKNDEQIG